MKLPKTITVGPHEYTVRSLEHLGDNFGECHYESLEILISAQSAPSVQEETLWHEVVEAMNHTYEMNLPHRTIQVLGAAFYQALKSAKY